ncbi:putative meiotically up-regulated gene 72 protein [Pseudovirgaria hyperparasitica]|uniref:Putative meiotically up-regulated gene 72 protein n=1 Tax=Pseudovirgaria hyperparasitica TaxID=470096 RepID=A0A6A6VRZ5_9PEZI|nr:putative meiotically up-regulated gene 72 protein [Pseudovirgaria hyperparasitica]KAF2753362.1 putative meiotically up-regulated gene 72 protein [Pseudovirgaria hyperparasitica]
MAPNAPRLKILSVGGNAVSAFLSWRLQATNACDVTLVWKSGFESVAQYGITFKSKLFGNERFKPYSVVRTPEDASHKRSQPFDYVLLCVKALPDVYDLAAVIESVVQPQHTCILINTTYTLGVESYLEQRFPTNVVLSLVSGAEIQQLGPSEFEHMGATDIWVGSANKNPAIPASIQSDMADALAMTLSSGQVDCKVSPNIRQQQYEKMIGNIAFHPASVLFETPNHNELLEKVGVRPLVTGIIDELLKVATAQGCVFPTDFAHKTMESMCMPQETNSIMYQDFTARRPMEVETYLGSPMKLAQEVDIVVPRIETMYAMLHHINLANQNRATAPPSPTTSVAPPRMSSMPPPRGPSNGGGPMNGGSINGGPMNGGPMGPPRNGPRPGSRAPSMTGSMGPPMRRGPPPMNGYGRHPNGHAYPGPPMQRRPSFEGNDLEEFSHLVLYDDMPEGEMAGGGGGYGAGNADIALRERELAIRQRELALKEREMHMRRGGGGGGGRGRGMAPSAGFDDDDDEDDYFDAMGPSRPTVDTDNFDMMSVTSRRARNGPSASQIRKNPELMSQGRASRNIFGRPKANKRTSASLMADVPGLHDSLMNNPLMGYSSNRYGNVDRQAMGQESRTNSLTASRLDELGGVGGGSYPSMSRRTSQSPGNPFGPAPGQRNGGRPSPPNGYFPPGGMNGRPSPPGMRQPVPRYPPGQGNAVAPQQVEQHAGVSNLYPPKAGQVRSLTGSASASAGSGDSARIDSENSAHSSQSSLGPRPPIGVR